MLPCTKGFALVNKQNVKANKCKWAYRGEPVRVSISLCNRLFPEPYNTIFIRREDERPD